MPSGALQESPGKELRKQMTRQLEVVGGLGADLAGPIFRGLVGSQDPRPKSPGPGMAQDERAFHPQRALFSVSCKQALSAEHQVSAVSQAPGFSRCSPLILTPCHGRRR